MLRVVRADVRYLRREILRQIYHARNGRITLDMLADSVGCHKTTVIRNINALKNLGYIHVTPGRGHGVASQYDLLPPAIEDLQQ